MSKKLLMSGLAMIVIIAVGTSIYNVYAGRSIEINPLSEAADSEIQVIEQLDEGGPGQDIVKSWNQSTDTPTENAGAADIAPVDSGPENLTAQLPGIPNPADNPTNNPGNGQGNRYGQGRSRGQGNNIQAGAGDSTLTLQNSFQDWVSLRGTVSEYVSSYFTLVAENGQNIQAQLGNPIYLDQIGLSILDGDLVVVDGFYDADGGFAIGQITLDSTGQTYVLRDELGRPLWSGGPRGG
jgi:hypothetical protein